MINCTVAPPLSFSSASLQDLPPQRSNQGPPLCFLARPTPSCTTDPTQRVTTKFQNTSVQAGSFLGSAFVLLVSVPFCSDGRSSLQCSCESFVSYCGLERLFVTGVVFFFFCFCFGLPEICFQPDSRRVWYLIVSVYHCALNTTNFAELDRSILSFCTLHIGP